MTMPEALSLLAGVIGALGAAYTWYSSARKAQYDEQQSEFVRMRDLLNMLQAQINELNADRQRIRDECRAERTELLHRIEAQQEQIDTQQDEITELRAERDGLLHRVDILETELEKVRGAGV